MNPCLPFRFGHGERARPAATVGCQALYPPSSCSTTTSSPVSPRLIEPGLSAAVGCLIARGELLDRPGKRGEAEMV